MIDRSEILAVAGDLSLTAYVVEKDYVLGWLLAGIYAHEDLASVWTFKGGTCLKKCYFEIPGRLQHPEYIANWAAVLRADNKAIWTAGARATEAVQFCSILAPGRRLRHRGRRGRCCITDPEV